MKNCATCQLNYPDAANYCSVCGKALVAAEPVPGNHRQTLPTAKKGNWKLFWLTLGGSLLLTWVMVVVFDLPVFILGAFLPLFWLGSSKNRQD